MRQSEAKQGKPGPRGKLHLMTAIIVLAAARVAAQQQTGGVEGVVTPEPTPQRRIVISIPDRKLALLEDGQVLKVYRIAVGARATASPTGEFRIINRLTNPTYYAKGVIIPPGKANPLGTRWMGLSLKGYGIHGTNAPRSIGKAASHGCFRMAKSDLEELFALISVGDVVDIRSERDTVVAQIFSDQSAQPTVVASEAVGVAGQN